LHNVHANERDWNLFPNRKAQPILRKSNDGERGKRKPPNEQAQTANGYIADNQHVTKRPSFVCQNTAFHNAKERLSRREKRPLRRRKPNAAKTLYESRHTS
jgi:hypothetical protein